MADNIIDTLNIEITSNFADIDSNLKRLTSSLRKLESINTSLESIKTSNISKITNLSNALSTLASVGNNPGLRSVINQLSRLSMINIGSINGAENITNIADKISNIGGTKPFDDVLGNSLNDTGINELTETIDDVKAKVEECSIKISSSIKKNSKEVNGLTKHISKLGESFKSIFIRQRIYEFLNGLKLRIKEGIEHVYKYSQVIDGTFAPAMDRISTSSSYLTNSLGAMASSLLEAVAPAIDWLVDAFARLLNIINLFFATLSGKGTYTKAIKNATKFGESVSGAAKSIKSLIAGFDELNVFEDSKSSGGGSASDFGSMFEEVPINDLQWDLMGIELGEKINEAIRRIDEQDIGKTIAEKLNNIISFAYNLLSTIDFTRMGIFIGDELNNLVDNLDWVGLGKTIGEYVVSLPSFLVGLIGTIDWIDLMSAFFGLGYGFGESIENGISDALNTLGETIRENMDDKKSEIDSYLHFSVKETLGKFLANLILKWAEISNFVSDGIATLKKDIENQVEKFSLKIKEWWENIKQFFKNSANAFIGGVETVINGVIKAINNMVDGLNSLSFDVPWWVPILGGKTFGFDLKHASPISIPRLADGGFVDTGQLFIAREAGAEMVGNIGNRTAVANNDQIVEGIYEGVLAAMQQSNGNGNFNVNVYLDGKQITASVEKTQRERGKTIYPGGVLYGV